MSVSIEAVEFERREAYLSELEDGPPYTVHGVALGADDVTVGQSGIKKLWPAEELEEAADTLEGTNLVVDHENTSSGVVGKVTKAGYKEDVGILYEAELHDEDLAEKIEAGLLEVSVRGYHNDVSEMEEDDETGAKVVENIKFQNLSIVPTGAAPSNSIEMGEAAELSANQIQVYAASLQEDEEEEDEEEEDEDPEYEPGDTVQWGNGRHGIVLEIDEDEKVATIDVYKKEDGTWRSQLEEAEVKFSSLNGWDIDMSNIGTAMNEDEEENAASEELDYSTYSVRKPDFDGTTESDWSNPDMEDFDTDDLSEIGTHFIGVRGDWPADEYGDLILPVVEPNGDLNLSALQTVRGGRGVTALEPEPSDEMVEDVFRMTANLANNNFDVDWAKDPEEASGEGEESEVGEEITHDHIKEWSPERYPEGADEVVDDLEAYLDEHDEASLDDFTEWTDADATETVEVFRESIEADEPTIEDLHAWTVEHLAENDEEMDDSSDETDDRMDEVDPDADTEDDESDDDDSTESNDNDGLAARHPAPVMVLTGDDFRRRYKSGESEKDSTSTIDINTTMNEEIEQKLEELNEPVAVEKESLDELQEKADQFEEMNSSLEDLRERTEVLDEVDREQVEELAESEDPVVLESSRYEQLTAEAEQVKTVYAAALADEMPAFDADELTDRFSIEELREKYEDQIGDPEEELAPADPDPRSEDPSEEELSEDEPTDEEKEAKEKQAELREKILGDD